MHAIAQHGLSLLLAGVIVTLAPLIVATYFGKLVLKMNPAILCGALAGAQTNAAVLNAVNEAAQSTAPVMGFTLPFAVNNLLLTLAASIIVATSREIGIPANTAAAASRLPAGPAGPARR